MSAVVSVPAIPPMAIALYGEALALRRPVAGGLWLGIGAAIAFLSKGSQGPAWLALAALIMLGYLLTLIATIYSFYTFVLGAPLLGKSAAAKAVPFTLVVVLCAIVLAFLTSFVFSGMAPRSA